MQTPADNLLLVISLLPVAFSLFLISSRWLRGWIPEVLATFLPLAIVINLLATLLLLLIFGASTGYGKEVVISWLNFGLVAYLIGRVKLFAYFKNADTQAEDSNLRVVSFNKLIVNEQHELIARRLKELEADIIGMCELWPQDVKPLLAGLEQRYKRVTEVGYGLAKAEFLIASRHPIKSVKSLNYGQFNAGVRAVLEVKGKHLVVYFMHMTVPLTPFLVEDRTLGFAQLAHAVKTERTKNIIVMGDFNMTPWVYGYQQFKSLLGENFYNAAHGRGLKFSWRNSPGIYAQVDHIFVNERIKTQRFRTDKRLGSDHKLIYADLSI